MPAAVRRHGSRPADQGRHPGTAFFLVFDTAIGSRNMNDLDQLVGAAQAEFAAAPTPAELENAKARYLGKAGRVTELLKALGALPVEQKKTRGAEINQAKTRIESALNDALTA